MLACRDSLGAMRRFTLGSWPDMGIGDARKAAQAMRVDVRRGADPIAATRGQFALCACCPAPLVPGRYAVAVVTGASGAAVHGISLGICTACAIEPDDLLAKAREGLTRIWPDLRPVAVTHPAGSRA